MKMSGEETESNLEDNIHHHQSSGSGLGESPGMVQPVSPGGSSDDLLDSTKNHHHHHKSNTKPTAEDKGEHEECEEDTITMDKMRKQ